MRIVGTELKDFIFTVQGMLDGGRLKANICNFIVHDYNYEIIYFV